MVAKSTVRGKGNTTPDAKLLAKKERLLEEKEHRLLVLANDLEKRQHVLDAEELRLHQKHTVLRDHERKVTAVHKSAERVSATEAVTTRRVAELLQKKDTLTAETDALQKTVYALKKGLAVQTDKFKKGETILAEQMRKLAEAEKHLERKQALLRTKEAVLDKEAKGLDELRKSVTTREQRVLAIESKADDVAKRERIITQREKELAKKMKEVTAQQTSIMARTSELSKKEKLVAQQIALFSETSHDLDVKEAEILARQRELDEKEKRIIQQDLDYLDHADRLKELQQSLAKDAEALHEEIGKKERDLAQARVELAIEKTELKETRAELRALATRNDELMSGDLTMLSKKEDELARTAKKFQTAAAQMHHDEKEFDRARESLLAYESQLTAREQKLRAAEKELLTKERAVDRREHALRDAQSRVDALQNELKKSKELKTNIKLLAKQESVLERALAKNARNVQTYTSEERTVAAQSSTRQSPSFDAQTGVHLLQSRRATKKADTAFDAGTIVQAAKQFVESRDIMGARDAIARLEQIQRSLKDDEEKRLLGYDILELKTSLKLALLA